MEECAPRPQQRHARLPRVAARRERRIRDRGDSDRAGRRRAAPDLPDAARSGSDSRAAGTHRASREGARSGGRGGDGLRHARPPRGPWQRLRARGRSGLDGDPAAGARARPRLLLGTFLSETHVELLGGAARVRAEAPVALVDQLDQLTYLQLTERVDHTPESALRALRAFLEPLLPAGYGSLPFDPFPPLRVLAEDLRRPPRTADTGTTRPTRRRGPALVFKHEEENEHGEPIGPAIFSEDEQIDYLGWMTLAEARALATNRGWRFAEN